MRLLLFAVLAGLAAPQSQRGAPPLESGVVREVQLAQPSGTLVQHFRLDRGALREDVPPSGLARWTSGPDLGGGLRVELELFFLEDGVRVFHSERASSSGRVLVFREVRERAGRTLFLEGSPEGGYASIELSSAEPRRRAHAERGELPLLLLEAARRGAQLPASTLVFDPLGSTFETTHLELGLAEGAQRFELRRADGSRRWRVVFREGLPIEMGWQEDGPVARAIVEEDYQRLLAEHEARRHEREQQAATARSTAPLAER